MNSILIDEKFEYLGADRKSKSNEKQKFNIVNIPFTITNDNFYHNHLNNNSLNYNLINLLDRRKCHTAYLKILKTEIIEKKDANLKKIEENVIKKNNIHLNNYEKNIIPSVEKIFDINSLTKNRVKSKNSSVTRINYNEFFYLKNLEEEF